VILVVVEHLVFLALWLTNDKNVSNLVKNTIFLLESEPENWLMSCDTLFYRKGVIAITRNFGFGVVETTLRVKGIFVDVSYHEQQILSLAIDGHANAFVGNMILKSIDSDIKEL